MANPEHVAILLQGREAFVKWLKELDRRQRGVALDLSGADLRGADLSQFPLARADLRGADLRGTSLKHANLDCSKLHKADLRGADLEDARLTQAEMFDAKLCSFQGNAANLTRASLQGAKLDRANLENANLNGANLERASLDSAIMRKALLDKSSASDAQFTGTDLAGASFRNAQLARASFRDAVLDDTDFFEAEVEKVVFLRARGLRTARNLTTVRRNPYDFQGCDRRWQEHIDWERISTFGRLRLLGVSYTALVLIILYIYALDFYNAKVAITHAWASNVAENSRDLPPQARDAAQTLAFELQSNLRQQRPPRLAFHLVASFLLLAVASTIYHFWCPEEIKTFSRVHWCYALARPLIHYWPLCWKHRWLRLVSFTCYVLGAFLALYVVATKVLWVMWYLLKH